MTDPKPVWLRAVMVREGQEVVTRCCVVTDGQFFPIEVRVNVPKLIASLRSLGLDAGHDTVGGFGSFIKKAVKKVSHNKVMRAVGHIARKVTSSPLVQIANPALAISAHTLAEKATGKGTIKGPLGAGVSLGAKLAMSAAGPSGSIGSGALNFVSPRAAAALGVGLKTAGIAKAAGSIAAAAQAAAGELAAGKAAAAALAKGTMKPATALPLVRRAQVLRQSLPKVAPALAKKLAASTKIKAQLATIAQKAKAGSSDARLAAAVVARSAKALDEVARLKANAAGGMPGLLITADGRIVRAPKGRFQLRTTITARPDVLYRGPKEPLLEGLFSAVSGWGVGASPGWGGEVDPGNDLEGPLPDLQHPDGPVRLDVLTAGTPRSGWLTP